jgi:serine/threonine protein kinase
MTGDDESRSPVELLAEEFLERYRRGERPTVAEYKATHPNLAEDIGELFPGLVVLEQADDWTKDYAEPPGPSADGRLIERLGDYRVVREIGRGGMGIVYEAVQESLGRQVALKVLPDRVSTDPTRLQRFRREARSAARLHHTAIVPVFEVGECDGIHYFAMQLISGRGLNEVLVELRRLRTGTSKEPSSGITASLTGRTEAGTSDVNFFRNVARIGVQVAEALAYAHGQKIVHRDVKPSNILIDTTGAAWVTDFGLAKEEGDDLTQTGDIVGTLRYMAPERFTGVTDARGDVTEGTRRPERSRRITFSTMATSA